MRKLDSTGIRVFKLTFYTQLLNLVNNAFTAVITCIASG